MENEILMKFKAERFRERLESMLKKFPPDQYAEIVSMKIHESFQNHRLMGRYPIHFLLHSIQANCAFHNTNRTEVLTEKRLQQILNHYRQYFDPVAAYFLEKEDGVEPFLINLQRQQFFAQRGQGVNSIGRAILLFIENQYPKSEKYIMDTYGISFKEWLQIGFAITSSIYKKQDKRIPFPRFLHLYQNLAPEYVVTSFFQQNSISPMEVKEFNQQIDEKVGKTFSLFYETYLQGVFVEKPMLRLDKTDYLIIHEELFLEKAINGIYDLCKRDIQSDFGMEFGHHFEGYIIKLLKEFIPHKRVFTEKQLRILTDKKICDVMLVFDDYIFLIECKGVEYSAYIATENSMRSDNSSRKISKGFDQLCSAVNLINSGAFESLIGKHHTKKVIAAVVTYKQLIMANSQWYYDNNILSNMKSEKSSVEHLFSLRPQIMSVEELELLLTTAKNKTKSYYELFHERLAHGEHFLQGDWVGYLERENSVIPLLQNTFYKFTEEIEQKLQ
ncbi:hypothetical protein HGO21_08235 [Acinetobacter sp. CUI P1]|nr:hypothetical protein [Acinetobacter sp. CUI P1]